MSKIPPVKVVFLGDTGVGKTCMIDWYTNKDFKPERDATKGAMFTSKVKEFPEYETSIKFHLWDTAGQEKYRSLAEMYYKDAAAAILVYSVTNEKSFEGIKYWMSELKARSSENIKIAIAANKCDLIEQEAVDIAEAKKFAEENNAFFKLTSAKDGTGIEKLFEYIAQALGLLDKKNATPTIPNKESERITLNNNPEKKDKVGCC